MCVYIYINLPSSKPKSNDYLTYNINERNMIYDTFHLKLDNSFDGGSTILNKEGLKLIVLIMIKKRISEL